MSWRGFLIRAQPMQNKSYHKHQKPVEGRIVREPHEYLISSARNYASLPNLIDIILESPEVKTFG
jgi:hypothetical protein